MSEKQVYAASRTFTPFFGRPGAPKQHRNVQNTRIPLLKTLFQEDSMRLRRIDSAKGAFTLSIDRFLRYIGPGGSA